MSNHHQNREILIFGLVSIVFLAGCAQSSSTTGNGLAIKDFKPDLDKISGTSSVDISMVVENTGENDASNLRGELVGLDEWNLQAVNRNGNELCQQDICPTETLTGVLQQGRFKGGQSVLDWKATSPSKSFDQTYQFSGVLYYSYKTNSNVLVTAMNYNYFKTLTDAQKAQQKTGVVSVVTTKGPLDVTVTSQQTLVTQQNTLPIEIQIQNSGGGQVFKLDDTATKPTKDTVDQFGVKVSGATCNSDTSNLRLSNGKSARIVCNIDTSQIGSIKTTSVNIEINYRYSIQKTSSITVLKNIGTG